MERLWYLEGLKQGILSNITLQVESLLYFDGVNDFTTTPKPAYNDFTIAIRYKNRSNSGNFKSLFATQNYSSAFSGDGIALYLRNATFEVWRRIGGVYTVVFSTPQPTLNTLHDLVLQKQGSTIRLYINNTLVGSGSVAGINDISPNFYMGDIAGHGLFETSSITVADLKIYDSGASLPPVGNLVYNIGFNNLYRTGANVLASALLGSDTQLVNYSAGALGLVGLGDNTLQLVP